MSLDGAPCSQSTCTQQEAHPELQRPSECNAEAQVSGHPSLYEFDVLCRDCLAPAGSPPGFPPPHSATSRPYRHHLPGLFMLFLVLKIFPEPFLRWEGKNHRVSGPSPDLLKGNLHIGEIAGVSYAHSSSRSTGLGFTAIMGPEAQWLVTGGLVSCLHLGVHLGLAGALLIVATQGPGSHRPSQHLLLQ